MRRLRLTKSPVPAALIIAMAAGIQAAPLPIWLRILEAFGCTYAAAEGLTPARSGSGIDIEMPPMEGANQKASRA
jgi:hypothetical protein